MPLFTIITVCYNAQDCIENTIQSVLRQNNKDYEYLIIDGMSQDNTLQIVERYQTEFLEKQVSFCTISEKDTGIYNAMNKGIDKASGEWMIFLNAGDVFYDGFVLEKVSRHTHTEAGVICGATFMVKDGMYKIDDPVSEGKLPDVMPACHQSIFWKSKILKQYKYNETYKICADRECLTRYAKDNIQFYFVNDIISKYTWDGVSSTEISKLAEEVWKIKCDLFHTTLIDVVKNKQIIWINKLLEMIRSILPVRILSVINRIRLQINGWEKMKNIL